jgi:hypothetical protein
MDNELDTFLMTDQQATCPKCGARTGFIEVLEDESIGVIQIHQCFDEKCQYKFEVIEF